MKRALVLLFGLFSISGFAQTNTEAIAKINLLLKKAEGKAYEVPYGKTSIVMKIKKQVLSSSVYEEVMLLDKVLTTSKTSKLNFAECYQWRYAIDDSDKLSGVIFDFKNEMDVSKTYSDGEKGEESVTYLCFYVLKADVPALLKSFNVLAGKGVPEEVQSTEP